MDTNIALGLLGIAALGVGATVFAAARKPEKPNPVSTTTGAGALMIPRHEGQPETACPLKHTDVKADISGFLARVTVTQEFENPLNQAIEAVYVFPLPNRAAVDDMTMKVGDRTVKGLIKKREEARQIYESARSQGQLTSLLDQERPNVFTQSVANIGPGMKVQIVISYVETLKYEAGSYEFTFPMVVGPRYYPKQESHGSVFAPPVAKPGTRAGHDISLAVNIDAGVSIQNLAAKTHDVETSRPDQRHAVVHLKNQNEIPNRDFILNYQVAAAKVQDAILAHRDQRGGFFTLILQPPQKVSANEVTPKEMVFVIDTSGSMHGFPLEKTKEVIKLALDGLHPRDTFNLITFSGDTHILFDKPVSATPENVRKAQQFLLSRNGSGGTEMMKAIRASLDPSDQQDHVRIVCFMTDGYVGNDAEIIDEVRRHSNARVFSFGIGSSVNRFLLDKMAEAGRGDVEYVALNDDGSAAAKRFWERVRNPLLTDISVDWNGLSVSEVYPQNHPDLFDAKPVYLTGRYNGAGQAVIKLKGKMRGQPWMREIPVNFPSNESKHDVLATLWARTKVEHLQTANPSQEVKDEITNLGLNYRLMTQYTSFVAVEEKVVNKNGAPTRIEVPVELPHGVSYEGIFGDAREAQYAPAAPAQMMAQSVGGSIGFGIARRSMPTAAPRPVGPAQPEIARRAESKAADSSATPKLDPQLMAIVAQLRNGTPANQISGQRFVANGKANVKVWLTGDPSAWVASLKKLGLEVVSTKAGNVVIGRIALEKLEGLSQAAGVLFVSAELGQP